MEKAQAGGALAIAVGDRIVMLENAIYSILSPEGFASILYKDSSKAKDAAENMKATSYDLKELGIIDKIIEEPYNGVQNDFDDVTNNISKYIDEELKSLKKLSKEELLNARYEKFRNM